MTDKGKTRYCRVPERVADTLKEVLNEPSLKRMSFEWELFSKWATIVGEGLGEFTTPIDLRNRTLHLRVENAVWRSELHYRKQEIIEAVNKAAGHTMIDNVLFR